MGHLILQSCHQSKQPNIIRSFVKQGTALGWRQGKNKWHVRFTFSYDNPSFGSSRNQLHHWRTVVKIGVAHVDASGKCLKTCSNANLFLSLLFLHIKSIMAKNAEKAIKKTTNKIARGADNYGTKRLDDNKHSKMENPLDVEYVNQVHVSDFMKALAYDPVKGVDTSNAEHISAWTDALPVRSTSSSSSSNKKQKKPSKRKLREQEAAKPKGISHSLLQYPLIVSRSFIAQWHSALIYC